MHRARRRPGRIAKSSAELRHPGREGVPCRRRNLHPLVLYNDAVPGESERAEMVSGAILRHPASSTRGRSPASTASGHKTAPHAENVERGGPGHMELIRCAFDPTRRANRAKIFPNPRLCGEVPGHRAVLALVPHPATSERGDLRNEIPSSGSPTTQAKRAAQHCDNQSARLHAPMSVRPGYRAQATWSPPAASPRGQGRSTRQAKTDLAGEPGEPAFVAAPGPRSRPRRSCGSRPSTYRPSRCAVAGRAGPGVPASRCDAAIDMSRMSGR